MLKKKIIIANWKMGPDSIKEATGFVSQIFKKIYFLKNKPKIVICPPLPYISEIKKNVSSNKNNDLNIGAQDCFYEDKGPFTGEISSLSLKSLGVKYITIGHHERRLRGETNEIVNKKLKNLLKNGFTGILCVGEIEKDETGNYLKFIEEEIRECLKSIQKNYLKNIIVAYQPISNLLNENKNLLHTHEIKQISIFIKKILVEICGREIGLEIPIVYGGNFDKKNFEFFFLESGTDGLLTEKDVFKKDKFLELIKLFDNVK
ncbi:MAG: triose-phosphate isomerase family protein [bacterium]